MRTGILARCVGIASLGTTVLMLSACASTGADSTTTPALPQGDEPTSLDPADFTTEIDNPYWPMSPGTRSVYREVDEDGTECSVVVTVTSDTKDIANGVTARVVRDSVFCDEQLVEDTFDWYAQDKDGAIWYLGEETAEFEDGVVSTTEGSFEAGVDGALAGVVMPAHPEPGQQYRQEYYRGHAEDNGEVMRTTELVDVPFGHFDDVVTTRDTSSIEPDVVEYKFYAPGVGPVMTVDVAGALGREVLLSVETVPPGTGTAPLGQPD
ncbi:hypothetical protein ACFQ58_02550 [Agromyces sp. NPDC056523]|uniref:hypothetical protein n=1 Tax=Agromyces sp. NPDC056523 TaxID=3345850 RepID=UPI0036729352